MNLSKGLLSLLIVCLLLPFYSGYGQSEYLDHCSGIGFSGGGIFFNDGQGYGSSIIYSPKGFLDYGLSYSYQKISLENTDEDGPKDIISTALTPSIVCQPLSKNKSWYSPLYRFGISIPKYSLTNTDQTWRGLSASIDFLPYRRFTNPSQSIIFIHQYIANLNVNYILIEDDDDKEQMVTLSGNCGLVFSCGYSFHKNIIGMTILTYIPLNIDSKDLNVVFGLSLDLIHKLQKNSGYN